MRKTIKTLITIFAVALSCAGFAAAGDYILVEKVDGKWKLLSISARPPAWKAGQEVLMIDSSGATPAWERVPRKYNNGSYNCPVFNTRQDYYWPCDSELTDTFYAYEGRGTLVDRKAVARVMADIDLAAALEFGKLRDAVPAAKAAPVPLCFRADSKCFYAQLGDKMRYIFIVDRATGAAGKFMPAMRKRNENENPCIEAEQYSGLSMRMALMDKAKVEGWVKTTAGIGVSARKMQREIGDEYVAESSKFTYDQQRDLIKNHFDSGKYRTPADLCERLGKWGSDPSKLAVKAAGTKQAKVTEYYQKKEREAQERQYAANNNLSGDDFTDAVDATKTGDYQKARKLFIKEAEKGNPTAQYNLGIIYGNGEGVKIDYAAALEWFKKAAERGEIEALNNIGFLYSTGGYGIKKDLREAFLWFKRAAEKGNTKAQFNVGLSYENGDGTLPDYGEAVKWYLKAAKQGHTSACLYAGYAYLNGKGVKRDYREALKWYKKAADAGNAGAKCTIAQMYARGEGVKKSLVKAKSFVKEAYEQGGEGADFCKRVWEKFHLEKY